MTTKYQTNTNVFDSLARASHEITEGTRRICSSISDRVQSLLGSGTRRRFIKKNKFVAGKQYSEEKTTDSSSIHMLSKEPSSLGKILTVTSFCVAGILSGIALSQISPSTNEFASNALHEIGLKQPTSHDMQISLTEKVRYMEGISAKAKQEQQQGKQTIQKLTSEKTSLESENKKLKQQLPSNKIAHTKIYSAKEIALVKDKQRIIDRELKKLLVLRGMKGVLKHEGVPFSIVDYRKYLKAQDVSLRVIQYKIALLQKNPAPKIAHSAQKIEEEVISLKSDNTLSSLPRAQDLGEADKSVALLADQKPSSSDDNKTPPDKDHPTHQDSIISGNTRENLSPVVTPPEISERSGLTQENITLEALQAFLSRANASIASKQDAKPLKGAEFSVKHVKVRGVPSLRVFLKRDPRMGYFTLKRDHPSRNYKIVSSESELMKWAEKKIEQWGVA